MAGASVALLLAMRSFLPMIRGLGPAGRHGILLLAAGAVPLALGAEVVRRRRERREAAARMERARARLARASRRAPDVDADA